MNFRLNESNVDRVFEKIAEGSRDGSFKELLQQDELRSVIQSGKAYAGFREAVITHPPTFKLQKKERGICLDFCKADAEKAVYKTKASDGTLRVPSWTDRILFYSLPLYRDQMEVSEWRLLIISMVETTP